MTLQAWSLPLSAAGRAALVPPPPWHFSGEALGIDFLADPEAVAAVLPSGLEPAGDGSCSLVFCDWSSSADSDPRLVSDPARGQYREAYFSVNALLDFARGHIQGFPKKMGTIAITRSVRVGRGGPKIEPGSRFPVTPAASGRRSCPEWSLSSGRPMRDSSPRRSGFR